MKQVDLNRLKGNFAEHVAASWLSRTCLIRPVATGTDIGIDFYCEAVTEGVPYLHFWVQVKAIDQNHIVNDGEGDVAWYDFEIKDLQYWKNQPIPVYAFLVPISTWPPQFPKRIYGVRITEHLVGYGTPDQGQIRIKSSGSFEVDNIDEDLWQFITKIVPWDTSVLLIQKGIISSIPERSTDLHMHYPAAIGFQYLNKVLVNIRDTAAVCILNALMAEQVLPEYVNLRKRFEQILLVFNGHLHELALSALVRAAHQDGDIVRARGYIEQAIAHLEQTQDANSATTQHRVEALNELLKEIG